MSDIRMGAADRYPFSFKVGRIENGHVKPVEAKYVKTKRYDAEDLRWVFKRITNENLVSESIVNEQ